MLHVGYKNSILVTRKRIFFTTSFVNRNRNLKKSLINCEKKIVKNYESLWRVLKCVRYDAHGLSLNC